jgi:methyltransferase-like protein
VKGNSSESTRKRQKAVQLTFFEYELYLRAHKDSAETTQIANFMTADKLKELKERFDILHILPYNNCIHFPEIKKEVTDKNEQMKFCHCLGNLVLASKKDIKDQYLKSFEGKCKSFKSQDSLLQQKEITEVTKWTKYEIETRRNNLIKFIKTHYGIPRKRTNSTVREEDSGFIWFI